MFFLLHLFAMASNCYMSITTHVSDLDSYILLCLFNSRVAPMRAAKILCKHERDEYMRVKNKLNKIKSVDSALQLKEEMKRFHK